MPETLPLTDLISNFISRLADQKKSPYTIVAYRKDLLQLREFLERIDKTKVEDITSIDIEGFLAELAEKNYTPKSIARKLNAIKGFFRWTKQMALVVTDPSLSVPHPKYELNQPRILSTLEYRALRDAARVDLRTAAIIEILLQTGMRISEVASLTLDDIGQNELRLVERSIPLNPAAKQALENYLKIRYKTPSQHLFVTKTGKPLLVRNIRASIERCFTEAGIENATVNDIRNTFIVHQLSRGLDLLNLSRIVGHKRLSTTERYLALVKEQHRKTTAALGEL